MVTMNNDKMCDWEIQKAGYLLTVAGKLGMELSGYGELDVNPHSGYTYLWLEDYSFTLYMPISCELTEEDIYVVWTDMEDGEEVEKSLSEFNGLYDIEEWVQKLEKEYSNFYDQMEEEEGDE